MDRSYMPHTAEDRRAMLTAIGVPSVQELFSSVPEHLQLTHPLDLPAAMSEPELVKHLKTLAKANLNLEEYTCFLGAGVYDHYIPSTVDHVLRRSEFYTAYTQYQPEISQGYLQALWEYQSMISEITGMEVANASMYDASTALAEAAMMACGVSGRKEIIVAKTVHPHYRTVLKTYAFDREYRVKEAGYGDGTIDLKELERLLTKDTAALIVQSPNFFGSIEDLKALSDMAHAAGAYLGAAVDPISLGVLKAPGTLGADIVVGEGQSLGIAPSFGGPYLGFFAASEKLMRKMPGRIVGQTVDQQGGRGFVLTLQTREQHIRREKANSNICSNEALCALSAAVYLSTVGKQGFCHIAGLSLQKAHYAFRELTKLSGCKPVFQTPFFKEFSIKLSKPVSEVNRILLQDKIIGGLDLGVHYPELAQCMLVCVTEKRTKEEIERLITRLEAIL